MRLTVEQIEVYSKYHGDEDGFARVATPLEKSLMSDVNWPHVANALQSLSLVRSGVTSRSFGDEIMEMVRDICADQASVNALLELAR